MRICKIAQCSRPVQARGLCWAHYERLRRHGDPSAGRTFHGDAQRYLKTKVLPYAETSCLFWPFGRGRDGYARMHFKGAMRYVHVLVCQQIRGAPPTNRHEAAHSCGNGRNGCVNPLHLSWKTHRDNEADKIGHGTAPRGLRNGVAKLTERDVREIRMLRGVPQRELATRFGILPQQVSKIQRGKAWAHLSDAPERI
jgi:hypothetical protein